MSHHRDWAKDGDLFGEIAQLRADLASVIAERNALSLWKKRNKCEVAKVEAELATVTAERDRFDIALKGARAFLDDERAAHAATQGQLQSAREMRDTYQRLNLEAREELAETLLRKERNKCEVAEVEAKLAETRTSSPRRFMQSGTPSGRSWNRGKK